MDSDVTRQSACQGRQTASHALNVGLTPSLNLEGCSRLQESRTRRANLTECFFFILSLDTPILSIGIQEVGPGKKLHRVKGKQPHVGTLVSWDLWISTIIASLPQMQASSRKSHVMEWFLHARRCSLSSLLACHASLEPSLKSCFMLACKRDVPSL